MKTFGIDYAGIDGNKPPDFEAAYKAGVRFAILRGAWGTRPDTVVKRDRKALRDAGIQFGAYLFLRCPTKTRAVDTPEEQVKVFCDVLGALGPGDLPPTLDVEFPGAGRTETVFSARQALEWCERGFLALCEVYPTVMTYTSARVWRDDLLNLSIGAFGDEPLWATSGYYWKAGHRYDLDTYKSMKDWPAPWETFINAPWIHQIQGDAIDVPGFNRTVDINLFLPMKPGEESGRVMWTQDQLGIRTDGVFGSKTLAAVRQLQRDNGLVDDGIVGPKTFAALCT